MEGLTHCIKQRFTNIASSMQSRQIDMQLQHLARLQGNREIETVTTLRACSICLFHTAIFTLDCFHRVCNTCVKRCAVERQPHLYHLLCCPLCQKENQSIFKAVPPTAENCQLVLGGTDPKNTISALKRLHRAIGLGTIPISEYFGSVVAQDSGTQPRSQRHLNLLRSHRNILCIFAIYRGLESPGLRIPCAEAERPKVRQEMRQFRA